MTGLFFGAEGLSETDSVVENGCRFVVRRAISGFFDFSSRASLRSE
jgi:hypothetical protein